MNDEVVVECGNVIERGVKCCRKAWAVRDAAGAAGCMRG